MSLRRIRHLLIGLAKQSLKAFSGIKNILNQNASSLEEVFAESKADITYGLEAGCVVLGVFIVGWRVPDGGDMSLVKSSFAFGLDAVAVVDRTAGISVMTEY